MFKSLRIRLLLTLGIGTILAVGAVGYIASRSTLSEFQRYVESDFLDYERFVNPFIVFKLQNFLEFQRVDCDQSLEIWLECQRADTAITYSSENIGDLHSLVTEMANLAGTRIIVTDDNGLVLANSHPSDSVNVDEEDVSGVMVVDGQPFLVYITLTDEAGFGARQQSFIGTVNESLLNAAIAAGLTALLLTLILSRRILRPVDELTRAARKLGDGDLSHRVKNKSRDEIGELAAAFNGMADSLLRLENLRQNMVSDVAHELRTPLSTLRGYIEAIQDKLLNPTPEIIDSLHEEVMLLNRLVDDLQDLALAEAGQINLRRQPISLNTIIDKAMIAVRPIADEKHILVSMNIPENIPDLEADPERLGQVLRNLLNNALAYTHEGGTITVRAHRLADGVEVSVEDSGEGISPEHLPNIFERFYRVDESRARSTGGAGLGLAIVKQLIQAHGGDVDAKSGLGKGTIITFTLPHSPVMLDPVGM
jgi:signal transduction histidine kinase